MEMVINGFAVNMASEAAIAPQSMAGWLMSTISNARSLPSHILAITKLDLAD